MRKSDFGVAGNVGVKDGCVMAHGALTAFAQNL